MSTMKGGKTMVEERHFRVCELGGKKVHIGGVSLKHGQSPLSAAMKLLSSIAHEKGLEKMNKLKLGTVHFHIQDSPVSLSSKDLHSKTSRVFFYRFHPTVLPHPSPVSLLLAR